MDNYAFLREKTLKQVSVEDNLFRPGKGSVELAEIEKKAGIIIPEELKQFYLFSYGAVLNGEYKILTINEIKDVKNDLQQIYGTYWSDNIFPFAYVIGVGDYFAFDLNRFNNKGEFYVVDGFHELPPTEWKGICFGLKTWLEKLFDNGFQPFWL